MVGIAHEPFDFGFPQLVALILENCLKLFVFLFDYDDFIDVFINELEAYHNVDGDGFAFETIGFCDNLEINVGIVNY